MSATVLRATTDYALLGAFLLVQVLLLPAGAAIAQSTTTDNVVLDTIMSPVVVSSSQKIAQQTPIANHNGHVYIVNIEPGNSGDEDGINLHTVIRHGEANSQGGWSWSDATLEERTIYDPWHTSPAVGVDPLGYVHVAYNMHNFPWQYSKSDQPNSIQSFTFRGDEMSLEEIKRAKFENKTSFKSMGYSAIPGNQITYPAFFNDATGSLYVTYRFAAKPALQFESRTMSAGTAKYDANTEQWVSLGGDLNSSRKDYETSWFKKDQEPLAIASKTNWTAYHPRLAFDDSNSAYLFFFWREGVAGETLVKPCITTTVDFQQFTNLQGEDMTLPVKPGSCSNIPTEVKTQLTYNTIGSIAADAHGAVYVVVSPINQARAILSFKQGAWSKEHSPDSATEIFVDQLNNLWAISSGLNIFRKSYESNDWVKVIGSDNKHQCYPKVSLNENKSIAYIYSQSCDDSNTVSVHRLDLTAGS